MRARDVIARIWQTGRQLQEGFNALARGMGLAEYVTIDGYPCSPHMVARDHEGRSSAEYRTLFLQETVAGGVLMPWIAISASHGPRELEQTLEASSRAMKLYARALDQRDAGSLLSGPVVKPVFRPYN
jgi:glutamate-1-semialdehyde 2,1-aminomutase